MKQVKHKQDQVTEIIWYIFWEGKKEEKSIEGIRCRRGKITRTREIKKKKTFSNNLVEIRNKNNKEYETRVLYSIHVAPSSLSPR